MCTHAYLMQQNREAQDLDALLLDYCFVGINGDASAGSCDTKDSPPLDFCSLCVSVVLAGDRQTAQVCQTSQSHLKIKKGHIFKF